MSSGSEDDKPIAAKVNGHHGSAPTISKADDRAMDAADSKLHMAPAGVSIRNGPIDQDKMDIDSPVNGQAKRKSRASIDQSVNYKDESSDDEPMAKRSKTQHKQPDSDRDDEPIAKKNGARLPPSAKNTDIEVDDSDDDEPLGKIAAKKANIEKAAAKEAKSIRADTKAKKPVAKKAIKDESSDDEPLSKPKRQANGTAAKKANGVKKEESDSDVPIAKRGKKAPAAKPAAKAATKAAPKTAAKGKAAAAKKPVKEESKDITDETDEEEEYKWWEESAKKEDDSIKWTTLEHNGVIFPEDYQRLPKDVKLLYDGTPVELDIEAEEAATFFGFMLNSTVNVENPTFQKNFFRDFKEILDRTGGAKDKNGKKVDIKEFEKLDFSQLWAYKDAQTKAKNARSSAEKKAEKAERDKRDAPYLYCKWDGRKEKVGNPRVEIPGLFRGRGDHPKTGCIKKRVLPEQITINIGKEAKVPDPPAGHKWKAVQHDNKATWLAMWQENINGHYKYVMLAANSTVKGKADFKKFEKARELKKHIDRIRADYTKDLKSEVMADRQRATAMYLIDKFALRAGNEKDTENEAETVGCCSLKYEHVTLREPNTVIFDFLGKDSIRFYNEFTVDRQVFKNLKMFKKPPKEDGDDIFDRLTTTQLNKHLSSYMPGLTAKVFRTYNASYTMSKLLQELKVTNATVAEKVKLYNDCNRQVAILCNHKRTVGASHEQQMKKLVEQIKGLRYQKWRTKMMMLDLDPKLKKKKGAAFFELDEDLTEEWVKSHQEFLVEDQKTKINKKFEKDNEKRVAEGEKPLPASELKERLKAASELEAKFKKENKTKKVEAEGKGPSVEKLEAALVKLDQRIKNLELQSADREGNKEVALGTSKINYIDPRLTVVFSAKFNVPIEKFFSKTLREKFKWAIESVGDDSTWEF